VIPVAVVSWDPIVLAGLAAVLSHEPRLRLVAQVATAADLHAQLFDRREAGHPDRNRPHPQVAVLFDRVDDGRPLDAVRRLLEVCPVVVACAFDRLPDPVEAIVAGVHALVSTRCTAAELCGAVQVAAGGGIYVESGFPDGGWHRGPPPDPADPHPGRGDPPATATGARLAPREEETLRWIASGFTHQQVARRMGVSLGTVATYVKRLRLKLHATNKAHLTRQAVALGYVPLRPRLPHAVADSALQPVSDANE
jgi:DNA-binding NarL/FixJ family response regulator